MLALLPLLELWPLPLRRISLRWILLYIIGFVLLQSSFSLLKRNSRWRYEEGVSFYSCCGRSRNGVCFGGRLCIVWLFEKIWLLKLNQFLVKSTENNEKADDYDHRIKVKLSRRACALSFVIPSKCGFLIVLLAISWTVSIVTSSLDLGIWWVYFFSPPISLNVFITFGSIVMIDSSAT